MNIKFRQSSTFLACSVTTWLITPYACTKAATYPRHKASNSKVSREKVVQLHTKKPDIPANVQVGAYRAAVYTTKIILALTRVSRQQSQPFMVRVEINIAESVVWGASGHATHLRGAGLCR